MSPDRGRYPSPQGFYLLDHPGLVAVVLALLVALVAGLTLLAKRRERNRRHSRYEFDKRGRLSRRVPPNQGGNKR